MRHASLMHAAEKPPACAFPQQAARLPSMVPSKHIQSPHFGEREAWRDVDMQPPCQGFVPVISRGVEFAMLADEDTDNQTPDKTAMPDTH